MRLGSSWKERAALPLVWLLFLLVRADVLISDAVSRDDFPVYAEYMMEQQVADMRGQPLHVYHHLRNRRRVAAHREAGRDTARLEAREHIEYPPLALLWLRAPTLGIAPLSLEPRKATPWRPSPEDEYTADYSARYPYWAALADLLLFTALFAVYPRLFPAAGVWPRAAALLVYTVGTAALWPVLYTRLDVVLASLVAGSLLLLLRVHYVWSFVLLAAAINFKIVPVVLVPVWLLGSLPAAVAGPGLFRPCVAGLLAARVGLLAALTAGMFLPFYLSGGPRTLGFFAYHRERGLEIESVYSSLLLPLAWVGHPVELEFLHGGWNVRSPVTPALVALAPAVCAAALAAAALALVRRLGRLPPAEAVPRESLARRHPVLFVRLAILFLLLFVVANKVLSPQYLLWLPPLVCLLPLATRRQRVTTAGFLAACGLTTVLFPYLFVDELVGVESPGVATGPYALGTAVLLARNLLLVVLAWRVWRDAFGAAGVGPPAVS